jgi:hypothetical protein
MKRHVKRATTSNEAKSLAKLAAVSLKRTIRPTLLLFFDFVINSCEQLLVDGLQSGTYMVPLVAGSFGAARIRYYTNRRVACQAKTSFCAPKSGRAKRSIASNIPLSGGPSLLRLFEPQRIPRKPEGPGKLCCCVRRGPAGDGGAGCRKLCQKLVGLRSGFQGLGCGPFGLGQGCAQGLGSIFRDAASAAVLARSNWRASLAKVAAAARLSKAPQAAAPTSATKAQAVSQAQGCRSLPSPIGRDSPWGRGELAGLVGGQGLGQAG